MHDFNGIYRGKILDNHDPLNKGRCKIFIPGVYSELLSKDYNNLPYAEPVISLFGGNYSNNNANNLNTETGISTVPHIGTEVWVFFENGNHNYPKFFGVAQGGEGWLSEHNNQHIIKTDNVTIIIDESFTNTPETSGVYQTTCNFNSYNDNGNVLSVDKIKTDNPTRVDIRIKNTGNAAVNLILDGDVNIKIKGNVYQDITGDKHERIKGNIYIQHDGDTYHVQNGTQVYEQVGNYTEKRKGNKLIINNGEYNESYSKDYFSNVDGARSLFTEGKSDEFVHSDKCIKVSKGNFTERINGSKFSQIGGNKLSISTNHCIYTSLDIIESSSKGSIYNQAYVQYYSKAPLNLREGLAITDQGTTINHNYMVYVPATIIYTDP